MRFSRMLWVIGFFVAAFFVAQPFTHTGKWERYTRAGKSALAAQNFYEADQEFRAALDEAKNFGATDPRFQESLDHLADLSRAEARSANFEPEFGRAAKSFRSVLRPAPGRSYAAALPKS